MGVPEIHAFLSYLSNERSVSTSTHHQALCALLFLYKHLLKVELPWIEDLPKPSKPPRQLTVLTRQEIDRIFAQMEGVYLLIARLLYGTGMRLMECAQLRVMDIDFQRREITIRRGKGGKDHLTMLLLSLVQPLRATGVRDLILYPSTTLHRVNTVTSGARLAAVGWVQSMIRNADKRELLFDLESARLALFAREGKSTEFDLLSKTVSNLLRMWGE